MDWINLHSSTLDSPAFVGSSPIERSTWLCLLRFCIGQENGGRIVGALLWKDRQWQQLARVTLREVKASSRLWTWEGDDLVVSFYPVEKEQEVKDRRATARTNGAKGGRPQKTNTETNVGPDVAPNVETHGKPTLVISAKAEGEGEGEREGEGNNTPQPPVGGLAADAAGVQVDPPQIQPPPEPAKKSRRKAKVPMVMPEVPPCLQTPAFLAAWTDWQAYRVERRLAAYKPLTVAARFASFIEWGEAGSIASIRESIRNNWQGLFPPRPTSGGSAPQRLESDSANFDDFKRRHDGTF